MIKRWSDLVLQDDIFPSLTMDIHHRIHGTGIFIHLDLRKNQPSAGKMYITCRVL